MGIKKKLVDDKSKYSESYIQQCLTYGYMTHPKYMLYNLHVFGWESDFLFCTTSGYWYEVEIKITLADFKNEFKHKKEKYEMLRTGIQTLHWTTQFFNKKTQLYEVKDKSKSYPSTRPNYFSYCVPYFLVDAVKDLIPAGYGLCCVLPNGRIRHILAPTIIHKYKYSEKELNLTEKFYYAYNNWRERCMRWHTREMEYRSQISWLRAEYKAATGFDVNDNL